MLGFSVKVEITVPLLCVCMCIAWKGRPRNDPQSLLNAAAIIIGSQLVVTNRNPSKPRTVV